MIGMGSGYVDGPRPGARLCAVLRYMQASVRRSGHDPYRSGRIPLKKQGHPNEEEVM